MFITKKNLVKDLEIRGARVYFWQASIFVGTTGAVLIMYLLKWSIVLTF